MYLKHEKLVTRAARPSLMTSMTQEISGTRLVNGAATDAVTKIRNQSQLWSKRLVGRLEERTFSLGERDANVGSLKSSTVVGAVSAETDGVAQLLQPLNQLVLLVRRHASEDDTLNEHLGRKTCDADQRRQSSASSLKQTHSVERFQRRPVDHPPEDVSSDGETVLERLLLLVDEVVLLANERSQRILVESDVVIVYRSPSDVRVWIGWRTGSEARQEDGSRLGNETALSSDADSRPDVVSGDLRRADGDGKINETSATARKRCQLTIRHVRWAPRRMLIAGAVPGLSLFSNTIRPRKLSADSAWSLYKKARRQPRFIVRPSIKQKTRTSSSAAP